MLSRRPSSPPRRAAPAGRHELQGRHERPPLPKGARHPALSSPLQLGAGVVLLVAALAGAVGTAMHPPAQPVQVHDIAAGAATTAPDPTPTGTTMPPAPQPAPAVAGVGYDVSYPQCRSTLPAPASFAIIGINGGNPALPNPCLAKQWRWARTHNHAAVYINTAYPGGTTPEAYGRKIATNALRYARAAGIPRRIPVWLDVETANTWNGTFDQHRTVLATAAAYLRASGHPVGLYTAPALITQITGGSVVGLPVWSAIGAGTRDQAAAECTTRSYDGAFPVIVQWIQTGPTGAHLDHNLICQPAAAAQLLQRLR